MDRKAREEKAVLVRQAIAAMKIDLKTATGQRQAELFHDMGLAYMDMEELMGDAPTEEPEMMRKHHMDMGPPMSPPMSPSPLDDPSFMDEGMAYMDEQIEMMAGAKEESKPNDNTTAPKDEVPMGAMAEHSNVYAGLEDENRQHVSYILDKVADITKAIEDYEHRSVKGGKTAKSGTARGHVASLMKKLAHVVNGSDFNKAETGTALDAVGVAVMAMHKQLGLTA